MHHQTFTLTTHDNVPVHVNHWSSGATPRAVVMLAHGMGEHSGRYTDFGQALAENGIDLYALDQRGHGLTAQHGIVGHFAHHGGWQRVQDDLHQLRQLIHHQHHHTPLFLFGHSMGSYIAQAYLLTHSAGLHGVVLSGSNYQPVSLYRAARLIARFEGWRQGPLGRSALIEWLSFGSFNKAFKPNRTPFDWLSRDAAQVDAYIADPLCGFRCTNQLWIDLLGGLQEITPISQLARIDARLPILVIGGECDPVSAGKRQKDLACALRHAGLRHVQLNLYPDARHELLHEANRADVTFFLIDWLNQTLAASRSHPTKETA